MNITPELKNAINQYLAGDADAYNQIYEESKNYIFNCIYKIVCTQNNPQDTATEIFNETFFEISQSLYQLQDVEKYFSWAGTIATRKCFDYLRQHNYYEAETDLPEDYPDDDNIIPETIMQNREKQAIIKQIIDTRLTEMEKLCVIAYYYNDMKQAEIAASLGIPENSVKTHLYRARHKIKEAVLQTEQTQGVRLHSLAPFMAVLLGVEMESMGAAAAQSTAVAAGQSMGGQSMTGQNMAGQQGADVAQRMTGQDMTGQNMTGQNMAEQNMTGQSMAGQQGADVAQRMTGQNMTGQNMVNQAGAWNVADGAGAAAGKSMAGVAKAAGMAAKTKLLIAAISLVCVGAAVGIVAVVRHNAKDKDKDTDGKDTSVLFGDVTESAGGFTDTENPDVVAPDVDNPDTGDAGTESGNPAAATLTAARQPIDQDDLNTCWIEYGLEGLEEKDFSDATYLDTFTFGQITDLPSIIRSYNYFWIRPYYEVGDGYVTDNAEDAFDINPDWFSSGDQFGDIIDASMWGTIKCFKEKPEGKIEWNTRSDLVVEIRNMTDEKISWATCFQNGQFLLEETEQATLYASDILSIDGVIEYQSDEYNKYDMDFKYTMSKITEILGKPTTVYMLTEDYESQFGQPEHSLWYHLVYDRGDYFVDVGCGELHSYGIERAETNEELCKKILDSVKIFVYTKDTYRMSDIYKNTDGGTTHIYEY